MKTSRMASLRLMIGRSCGLSQNSLTIVIRFLATAFHESCSSSRIGTLCRRQSLISQAVRLNAGLDSKRKTSRARHSLSTRVECRSSTLCFHRWRYRRKLTPCVVQRFPRPSQIAAMWKRLRDSNCSICSHVSASAIKKSGKSSSTWQLIAAIEAGYSRSIGADTGEAMYGEITWWYFAHPVGIRSHNEWFSVYQQRYGNWFQDALHSEESQDRMTIDEKSLRRVLDIALYSPANVILRSLLRLQNQILTQHPGTASMRQRWTSSRRVFLWVLSRPETTLTDHWSRRSSQSMAKESA